MKTAVTAATAQATSAWPRTPSPRWPSRSGILKIAGGEDDRRRQQEREACRVAVVEAARKTGAHRHAVAADPGDERGRLRHADDQRLAVLERRSSSCRRRAWRPRGSASSRTSAAFAQALGRRTAAAPLTIRKIAATSGLAVSVRSWCSKASPIRPAGMLRDDDQPRQPLVGVSARRLPSVRKKAATISTQSRQ